MDNLESQRDGESFLLKLTEIIRNNFDNEQFGVKEAARIFGVSRSHLHRRLKKLTGKSVSQFIRELRLEKAMELLQKDMATVSEIAYSVGFHSPTYFNTCFKERYGFTPGEAKIREQLELERPKFKKTGKAKTMFKVVLNESSLSVGSLSRAKYNISYIYGTLKIYRYVQKKVKR